MARTDNRIVVAAAVFGLALGVPIAVALLARPSSVRLATAVTAATATPTTGEPSPTPSVSASPSPTPSQPPTPAPVAVTVPTAPSAAPQPKQPQGTLALLIWHDHPEDNRCVTVETQYDNRSDTAIDSVTQTFQTLYTPKHADGTYPPEQNGPQKTLTQQVGIAAFTQKTVYWNVCAPELVAKQNPPPADGTDGFQEEIGAQPRGFRWAWFR